MGWVALAQTERMKFYKKKLRDISYSTILIKKVKKNEKMFYNLCKNFIKK